VRSLVYCLRILRFSARAIGSPTRSLGCCAEAATMADEQPQWWYPNDGAGVGESLVWK
jgi:hypothetical protein